MNGRYDAIKQLPFVNSIIHFDQIDSTNTCARSRSDYPASGCAVIIADRQTAGRGQRGNSFFSSISGGLWATIVVPIPSLDSHFVYNRAISLALAESIESFMNQSGSSGKSLPGDVTIKWPNDIYIGDRKVCGILLENIPGRQDLLAIGFGCNVNLVESDFPHDLRPIATSLRIQTGMEHDSSLLLKDVLVRFNQLTQAHQSVVHDRYTNRLYGREALIEINSFSGRLAGVREDGRLAMDCGGEIRLFSSGPMRVVK